MGSADNLAKVDHFIVLMLENRSFDDMLGWLYDPANPPPFDHPLRGQPFDGVSARGLANPIPPDAPDASRGEVPVGRSGSLHRPDPDPGETFERVNVQLFGTEKPKYPSHPPPMSGFVKDYITALRQRGIEPTFERYAQIMSCYGVRQVPVMASLARAYGVSDRWFSAVPTQTFPNRCFFHAGTSGGRIVNAPYVQWLDTTFPTVFNRLEAKGLPWKVYHADPYSLTWLLHRSIDLYISHIAPFEHFKRDCASGTLPSYAFIEPRFLFDPCDEHPPHSVPAGEAFVLEVYEAIRKSPAWEKTLLLITYDEHGGCYDHVPPPQTVPPDENAPRHAAFDFARCGVRVPAVFISPWTREGSVIRGGRGYFTHSSLIRSLCARFGLPGLTRRDAWAENVGDALSLEEPRRDDPPIPHPALRALTPPDESPSPGDEAAPSDFHHGILALAAQRVGVTPPEPETMGNAKAAMSSLVKKFPDF